MLPFNFLLAKFHARWNIINKDPEMIVEAWRKRQGRPKVPRVVSTDPGCIKFVEWVAEQLEKQGIKNVETPFSLLRLKEELPYGPDNCAIVPRKMLYRVSMARKAGNVTMADIRRIFKEETGVDCAV